MENRTTYPFSLKDRIIFITGASSGIGASCARQCAAHGAKLLLSARRIERVRRLAKDLHQQYGSEIHTFSLDVRDRSVVKRTLVKLPEKWKDVYLLINNAGLASGLDPLQDGNIDDWEKMIDTNVKGLLYVTRTLLPGMIKRGAGHIINIGSIAGHWVYPKGNVYCASKFAVRSITEGLRMDLLGQPIRVSTVDPGLVETEFSVVRFHGDKDRAAKVYQGTTPLTPDDVADAVLYCATRPPHVNIQEVMILPTLQASATQVHRASVQ